MVEVTRDRGLCDWAERGEASGAEEVGKQEKRMKKRVVKIIAPECVGGGQRGRGAEEAISPLPRAFVHCLRTDKE